jgi:hypothetical protein
VRGIAISSARAVPGNDTLRVFYKNRHFSHFYPGILPDLQARARFNMINNEKFPYSEREDIWCNSYNC